MSFFFNIVFLGFFLVLFGTSVLIKAFFNINIPLGKIFGAIYIMFLGVNMLMGINDQKTSSRTLHYSARKPHYHVAFGNQVIDLRSINTKKPNSVDVQVAFGNATLILDPDIATTIDVSSSFGSVAIPEEKNLSFGKRSYSLNTDKKPSLHLRLDVAFGRISVLHGEKVT